MRSCRQREQRRRQPHGLRYCPTRTTQFTFSVSGSGGFRERFDRRAGTDVALELHGFLVEVLLALHGRAPARVRVGGGRKLIAEGSQLVGHVAGGARRGACVEHEDTHLTARLGVPPLAVVAGWDMPGAAADVGVGVRRCGTRARRSGAAACRSLVDHLEEHDAEDDCETDEPGAATAELTPDPRRPPIPLPVGVAMVTAIPDPATTFDADSPTLVTHALRALDCERIVRSASSSSSNAFSTE